MTGLARRFRQIAITWTVVVFLFGLAGLSVRYPVEMDVTQHAVNTLSPATQKLLQSLPYKVEVTAYIKKGKATRQQIAQLIDRYSHYKANMSLVFADPDADPDKIRELAIGSAGLVTVRYQDRVEKINFIDESTLSNALLQLSQSQIRWVGFLVGHGERALEGSANSDVSLFKKELARRHIKTLSINLAILPRLPENLSLLVVAGAKVALLPSEMAILKDYVEKGGNLLFLTDPDNKVMGDFLSLVGVMPFQGALIDNNHALYGISEPGFMVATDYVAHPITQDFKTFTLYPKVSALAIKHPITENPTSFSAKGIIYSGSKSWTETGDLKAKPAIDYQKGEMPGPLAIAYALNRELSGKKQQRIVVVGDGDFLSNAYLGYLGNLDMGLRIINWLVHNDQFIDVPIKTALDKNLSISPIGLAVIAFGFLIILPVLLFGAGFWIGFIRRRR